MNNNNIMYEIMHTSQNSNVTSLSTSADCSITSHTLAGEIQNQEKIRHCSLNLQQNWPFLSLAGNFLISILTYKYKIYNI